MTSTAHGLVPGPSQGKIPELTGLRGVAALMVVFFHYVILHLDTYPGELLAYTQRYLTFLWAGVDVFFVLSGFLLGGILLDQRDTANCFKVFYLRRAVRILPSYMVLLSCYVGTLIWWRIGHQPSLDWLMARPLPLWSYVAYVQNFAMVSHNDVGALFVAPTWSLAIEEQFYLLLPLFVLRWCPPRAFPYWVTGLIASAPILRMTLFFAAPTFEKAGSFLLPTRWDSLLFGVLVAWLMRKPEALTYLRLRLASLRACLWIALAIAALIPLQGKVLTAWHATFDYTWLALTVAALLIYLRLHPDSWIAYFLRLPLLSYFGSISYTLYLFHVAALGFCFSLLLGKEPMLASGLDWTVMIVAFVATVLFAQVSWHAFEAPLVRFGHEYAYGPGMERKSFAHINQ